MSPTISVWCRAMADQVLVLKEGCMVEYGRLEEVLEHPKEAYTGSFCLPPLPCGGQKRKERGADGEDS